tara:strand:- start:2552 stop:2809 length:258 start_codon:yes stop_codon:yes gene_type:complete
MSKERTQWNERSKVLLKELHHELCINNKNWHSEKSDPKKRAAELLISSLTQLINNGEISEVENLIKQASKWLKGEAKDPGCPSRN